VPIEWNFLALVRIFFNIKDHTPPCIYVIEMFYWLELGYEKPFLQFTMLYKPGVRVLSSENCSIGPNLKA